MNIEDLVMNESNEIEKFIEELANENQMEELEKIEKILLKKISEDGNNKRAKELFSYLSDRIRLLAIKNNLEEQKKEKLSLIEEFNEYFDNGSCKRSKR